MAISFSRGKSLEEWEEVRPLPPEGVEVEKSIFLRNLQYRTISTIKFN